MMLGMASWCRWYWIRIFRGCWRHLWVKLTSGRLLHLIVGRSSSLTSTCLMRLASRCWGSMNYIRITSSIGMAPVLSAPVITQNLQQTSPVSPRVRHASFGAIDNGEAWLACSGQASLKTLTPCLYLSRKNPVMNESEVNICMHPVLSLQYVMKHCSLHKADCFTGVNDSGEVPYYNSLIARQIFKTIKNEQNCITWSIKDLRKKSVQNLAALSL